MRRAATKPKRKKAVRELDQIVQDIISVLLDWLDDANEYDIASAKVDVHATIQYLRVFEARGRSIRGTQRENIEDFTNVLKHARALLKATSKMSDPARVLLFSGQDDIDDTNPPSKKFQKQILANVLLTTSRVAWLRDRCKVLLKKPPGEHGSADHRKRRAAQEAWRMLRRFAHDPASGVATSVYGKVTTLLYEGMTGVYGQDLARACRTTLMLAKNGGLSEGGLRA
jgi:hypothetical protein